jgi:NAD-dependent dihydropyrimidine dehydrogenase PreA subunit
MKTLRKIIEIDEVKCDGCGQCVNACAEGALKMVNGKAKVVADTFCDGLGACIGECPRGALKIIEREADPFDEKAVEQHIKGQGAQSASHGALPCGCPGTAMQSFKAPSAAPPKSAACGGAAGSALTHWPVQIRLVPANAPFLKGADLLIAADCTAFAYAGFHGDLLAGKALMVGCPKLDDAQQIQDKFVDIFKTAGIKSVTVVAMEVPCCSRLPLIVKKALEISGADIPLKEIIVGIQGALR